MQLILTIAGWLAFSYLVAFLVMVALVAAFSLSAEDVARSLDEDVQR